MQEKKAEMAGIVESINETLSELKEREAQIIFNM